MLRGTENDGIGCSVLKIALLPAETRKDVRRQPESRPKDRNKYVGEAPAVMFSRPSTLSEACVVLARAPCQIIIGGTWLFSALSGGLVPDRLLDLSALKELSSIEIGNEHVRIGGTVTWSELAHTDLPPSLGALKQAARGVGSIQIRKVGTVAGNICIASTAADGVPPLLALDAQIELASSAGRRQIPLSEFIVADQTTIRRPDEILTAIIIPRTLEIGRSVFLKIGLRQLMTTSIAMVAAVVARDDVGRVKCAQIAIGACSAVAQRLPELERALVGKVAELGLSNHVEQAHLAKLSSIDDIRASAAYRRDAALTLIRRALEACLGIC
jgi:CO/xanthine dehydrogenase FAD-binding subunit